jgi:hypothetical protein
VVVDSSFFSTQDLGPGQVGKEHEDGALPCVLGEGGGQQAGSVS